MNRGTPQKRCYTDLVVTNKRLEEPMLEIPSKTKRKKNLGLSGFGTLLKTSIEDRLY
jgi:hypothetical protein